MNTSPNAFDLVVTGRIQTPDRVIDNGWIAVRGERIAAIGSGAPPAAATTHDAAGGWVLPGLIDGQTHAGSCRGLDGLGPTTRSAVAGGVTTIVDMPYDDPEPLATMDALKRKIDAIGRLAYGDVALYGTIAPGRPPTEVKALAEAGVCAMKISSYDVHPTRFPRIPANEILDLLETTAELDLPVGLHNEDQEIVKARVARYRAAGNITPEWHSPSRPPAAELASTAAFLELGAATGAHVHIVHLSLARGYDLVARYRDEGLRATAELCLHYLHFDAAEDLQRLGALMKVNPPIRAHERDKLWRQLHDGKVAFVSSDHSSWPVDNKRVPAIFDAGAGVPGLEALAPVFYTDLVQRTNDPVRVLVTHLAEQPAKFFGLWPRKGALAVGADADITILNDSAHRFDAATAHDELNWSPYHGEMLAARITATFVRGRLVWDGSTVCGNPGHGRFVPRLTNEAPHGS